MSRNYILAALFLGLTLCTATAFSGEPVLVRSSPPDGAVNVPLSQGKIVLEFSENMKMASWSLMESAALHKQERKQQHSANDGQGSGPDQGRLGDAFIIAFVYQTQYSLGNKAVYPKNDWQYPKCAESRQLLFPKVIKGEPVDIQSNSDAYNDS